MLTARMNRYHPSDKIAEATKVAIAALQEQAERESGCEYCHGDALKNLVLFHQFEEPKVAMHGGSQPIPEDEKPMFCPHCGKKL